MKRGIGLTLLGLVLIPYGARAQTQNMTGERNAAPDHPEIVFVCQHGAALSVVSAAYFNKLAKEEHLNVRALARGVTPDQDISRIAAKGFKALNDRRLAILGTQRACLGGRRLLNYDHLLSEQTVKGEERSFLLFSVQ